MNQGRPRGPLDDPRLVERRGDLQGTSALVFMIIVLGGFAVVGALLLAVLGGVTPASTPTPSPRPSVTPSPSPSPTPPATLTPPAPSGPVTVGTGVPATLVVDGRGVGTVIVISTQPTRAIGDERAPQGKRWLVATIRYRADADLVYDAARWYAVDETGTRYPWRGEGDPAPALGSGTLEAGKARRGKVTFEVPVDRAISTLVLTDEAGADAVIVTLEE